MGCKGWLPNATAVCGLSDLRRCKNLMLNIYRPGIAIAKQMSYRPEPATKAGERDLKRTPRGVLGLLLATPLVLSGCDARPLSTLDPASGQAEHIAQVWQIMAWGSLLILLIMLTLTFIAVKRRSQGGLARRPFLFLLGGGVVFPVSVMITLLIYTYAAAPVVMQAQYQVTVTARQWQWEVRYPDAPGGVRRSVNVIHIPAGTTVAVELRASDVIHGFWVPRLGGKMDAIPGRINSTHIKADTPGVYQGICAEYCGVGHAGMQFTVIAHEPEELAAVLASLPIEPEGAQ